MSLFLRLCYLGVCLYNQNITLFVGAIYALSRMGIAAAGFCGGAFIRIKKYRAS